MTPDDRSRWFSLLEKSRALLDRPAPEPTRDLFRPDALERWAERMPPKPEPEPPADLQPSSKSPPVDWTAVIDERVEAAIASEHEFVTEILAGVVAEMQAQANDDLETVVRRLTCELAELRATLGELRATIATERIERTGQPLDLPRLPRAREVN